ncbi:E3 ubiquitin-protein ligase RNF14-like [Triticum dicoccoides]|uniref:E3 ubiquitin-protein ligase RNF14-like n=1 Tax=Triticum dicoccoides TaxID=85692 RepID=UPI00188F199B|nr:E3 ubiquitin-protein ligase RNF14-like [Triticum dicoccoides]
MESPHGGSLGEGGALSPPPEAVGMLHEMALRDSQQGEEPDLPDEQLRSNDQLQQDEMLALEAIYGDNLNILGENSVPRYFQIYVYCEIPDGISVSVELPGVDDYPTKFSVEHLAPISLTCLMPPSYPSHHSPYFTLAVQWLDNVKISSLCDMLDSLWAQQPGQEVIFEWVQWLQSSTLSHFGFDDGIVIRDSVSTMDHVDVRLVGEILSVEDVVQQLINYNEEQCQESFLQGFHVCMICFSEYKGIDFIKLPCRHYFCRNCMETYSQMHVKEGSVMKIVCPDDKCGGFVPPNLLKRLLGEADFERWERLLLERTLDAMADVAYCPRCQTACLEDEDNAQCPKCLFSFCTRCRDRRHIGERCLTPEEKLLSLQEREKVRHLNKGDTGPSKLVDELSSIKEILRSCVPCPHCGTGITRVSGCNHMLCKNCGKLFCYGCGKPLTPAHTSEQCRIDYEKRTAKVDLVDAVKELQRKLKVGGYKPHPCPNCHLITYKLGNNNHVFCEGCQVHHCALCRKVVRKSSEHYGPRGCKQHTADPEITRIRPKKNDDSQSESL